MLFKLVEMIFNFLQIAIFVEVILSWVYSGRTNQYIELLHKVTEPILRPGRLIQERYFNNLMVDFSPIIALFMLSILRKIVLNILILIY
ncbi:YggT family protein [Clostridium sp. CS001]|uniref:YggT family protein n=1 Tax=Clostridium sp. CS001 TaxID=2880648 RepID=UPI001CF5477E|nr:YggT family protein [Clostridium sp. CS001]MCB2288915.1 YggT family protein [Clostridium sp. CS001]